MIDLDDLKADISIEDVLIECGAEIQHGLWGSSETVFNCPFHPHQETPAGSMNLMKGVFHCHSCGVGGSVIDAAMLHLSTRDVKEAAQWLEDEFL